MGEYMRIGQVAQLLGVTTQSVRRYVNEGRLKSDHTPSGQRIFTQAHLDGFLGVETTNQESKRIVAFYARSSNGKQELIQSQLDQLEQAHGKSQYIYVDKSSGLNANRKGLTRLLDDARDGKITHVAITQKDRIARFGVEYVERLLHDYGVELLVLHETGEKSLQEELMQDFMSLIASFSGKFYRIRGYEQKSRLLKEAQQRLS